MPEPADAPDFSEDFLEEIEIKVWVPKDLKAELIQANEFEDAVVKAAGSRKGVSLNKTYVRYLAWALEAGWSKQGGRPKNAKDREEKIRVAAELLKPAKK
jgi:hypothetical protein